MDIAKCNVNVASVYETNSVNTSMLTQLLYGETCRILEFDKDWVKIAVVKDDVEGWMDYKQLSFPFEKEGKTKVVHDTYLEFRNLLLSVGSEIEGEPDGLTLFADRVKIGATAERFLNVAFLNGGRSYFGLDASALVQLVMKVNGIHVPRYAHQQAELGYAHSFVEESEMGDLAFFENTEGVVDHVGIMLDTQRVIHAFGKVRVDILDSTGIFNQDLNRHTHKLRFVKNIL